MDKLRLSLYFLLKRQRHMTTVTKIWLIEQHNTSLTKKIYSKNQPEQPPPQKLEIFLNRGGLFSTTNFMSNFHKLKGVKVNPGRVVKF